MDLFYILRISKLRLNYIAKSFFHVSHHNVQNQIDVHAVNFGPDFCKSLRDFLEYTRLAVLKAFMLPGRL